MDDNDQREEIRKIVESDDNINTLYTDFINKIYMKGLCNVDFNILGGYSIQRVSSSNTEGEL